jgi:colanic acid/amylovoran biosynthesis glycosyltransferase
VLLEACAQLEAKGQAFELVLVGDGEQRASLEARAEQLGLSARTRFTGPLPADRVRAELAQAALFALPCRVGEDGNRDALPTVLLEAQAAGVPAISCPVGGVAEILDHGHAGWLVPEQDPTALAEALSRALANPAALEPLVARGRILGRQAFDRQQQARLLAALFEHGPAGLNGAAQEPNGRAPSGAGSSRGAAQ